MAVGEVPPQPRVGASVGQAWENIWPHFGWLLLFGLIAGLANGVGGNGSRFTHLFSPAYFILLGAGFLLSIFLGAPLSIGLTKVHLVASRGEKPTWKDLGHGFSRYWSSVGLVALTGLIVLVGFLLLIVPGIYYAVRLSMAKQRFVAEGLGIRPSLNASLADTEGRWWSVFGLFWMSVLLVIGGLAALIVGVFVAMVLIHQMRIVYWRSIRQVGTWQALATGAAATVPASPIFAPQPMPPPAPATGPAKPKPATTDASPKPAAKAAKKPATKPAVKKKAASKTAAKKPSKAPAKKR